MGYETRIHIVARYGHGIGIHEDFETGEELASIDLCKCGYSGPVADLIAKSHKEAKTAKTKFALNARNPERQNEAVKVLRELAGKAKHEFIKLSELSDHIEDGTTVTDKYGDNLGVIPVDEFLTALEESYKSEEYRRFKWAIDLIKSIKETIGSRELVIVTYGH